MSGNVLPIANTIQIWNNKKLVSNLYQDDTNIRESAYRTLNRQNFSQEFGPVNMGATSQALVFNKDSILNHVLVEFELSEFDALTLATDSPDFSSGRGLPEGWAWQLVRRYTMQYSGSNSLEIEGRQNFLRCMAECETKEKRQSLIKLGGNRVYVTGTIAGNDIKLVGADADGKVRGAVLLYTPHSSVSGAKQVGYDASQANSAPIIRLDLASAEEMYSDLSKPGDGATVVTSITSKMRRISGKFYVGETAMIDSANSRRDMVGPSGQSQSLMFFAYPGDFNTVVKVPGIVGAAGAVSASAELSRVTIDSFLNGSCQYLLLAVERQGAFEKSVGVAPDGSVKRPKRNPLQYVQLKNIKLTYGGGNSVYEAPTERIAALIDTVVNPLDSTYEYNALSRSGGDNVVTVDDTPAVSYFYRIQISQFSELYKMFSLLQTGANLGSDNLKLTFDIIDNFYQVGSADDIEYRVNVQQVYQTSMTTARGNIKWDFVNPTPQALPAQLQVST
jgi:hypothetical protein